MSMTGQNLVDDVRPLVNDVQKTTWSDGQFIPYINEGMKWIHTNQPESRLQSDGTNIAHTALSTTGAAASVLSATLWLSDMYRNAMVEYLAYRYFDADGSDTRDENRAKEHWANFLSHFRPTS